MKRALGGKVAQYIVLSIGAIVFLFPFYYMIIGSLQAGDTLVHLGVVLFVFGFGLGLCMQLLVLIVQNAFAITMVGTATAVCCSAGMPAA